MFCESPVCALLFGGRRPPPFPLRGASLYLRLAFSVRILFSLCHGLCIGLRNCQASAWPEVATFLIKRKWPKIDRGGPRAPSEAKGSAGGLRLGPPLVSWTVPSLRSPPGRAEGSSARRKASRGAWQPGPPLDSQRFQAAFWAPFPAFYPGGSGSPDSAANSGRAGLTPPSLAQRCRERQSYQGASGGPDSVANRAAGRGGVAPAGSQFAPLRFAN